MQILVTSATEMETRPLREALQTNPIEAHEIQFHTIGIGMLEASFHLQKLLTINTPGLIILAGIAGTFDKKKTLGQVFVIDSDQFVNAGVEENGIWKDIFDLGFADKNAFPYSDGVLINPYLKDWNKTNLPTAKAITIDEITTSSLRMDAYLSKYQPVIESMEGAALHYNALQYQIPFMQIRSISNLVGDRDKSNWDFKNSIGNLNTELLKIFQNL
ncbi:futalosine hydrolase [Rhizosphaericola mali]|uniref:Futalosine hydrolase n=1 Tax=Rhizosphaericola mali TaxID=2545455 RepID=A0A5P2G7Z4_9BACT|nr:futalosine hydrolase [Rhizosphaericola mali]QES90409.1 futalosine hydrolase [Rhizosphaericola mali]